MANAVSTYAPFPSPDVRLLRNDEFSHVLSFLGPKELAHLERVCKSWKEFIEKTEQWKKQCDYFIGISTDSDRLKFFPQCATYKNILQLVLPKIFDADTYQYYLEAEIGPVPPIPEEISLKRFNEPDPCEPTETIGQNYFWVYFPAHFEIAFDGDVLFELDREDDPNDAEAPMLIVKEGEKSGEKRVLKISNTINNITKVFKYRKSGNPSSYECNSDQLVQQMETYGNERIQSGWMCMREMAIGNNPSFTQQRQVADKAGVVIASLLYRMNFNFLKHLRNDAHPDPIEHTSTLVKDWGLIWSPSCGGYQPSVPRVRNFTYYCGNIGAAVALPMELHAVEP
ncbi:MAG TPA: F-box protein [Rhabdochlamydiaceae bacterium]|nr:F-box protein [Rhabdochlamydiaceae bacterium]